MKHRIEILIYPFWNFLFVLAKWKEISTINFKIFILAVAKLTSMKLQDPRDLFKEFQSIIENP